MTFIFKPMTKNYAEIIAEWKYEPPYDFYDFDSTEESVQELLNGDYFYVVDHLNTLVGYFCSGNSARVSGGYDAGIYQDEHRLDIGLGMNPSFTGKGQGSEFVAEGLKFMEDLFNLTIFRLVVATFNKRAINVYKKNGFQEKTTFFSRVNGKNVEFLCMET